MKESYLNQRKCKICKCTFTPMIPMARVCSIECAMTLARSKNAKAEKVEITRARKAAVAKLKTRSDWMREVQAVVNAVVRERDKDQPCISCGRHHQGQYHAGHYLSVGAHPELRFDLTNIHKQCQPCNTHLSGNQLEYRKGLAARYGQDYVSSVETPMPTRKYTVDELIQLKQFYKAKLKEMREAA